MLKLIKRKKFIKFLPDRESGDTLIAAGIGEEGTIPVFFSVPFKT
jgi:hypothetical protein